MSTDRSKLDYSRLSFLQRWVQRIFRFVLRFVARVRVEGRENIPFSGPVLLAANHVHFWLDGPVLFSFIPRRTVILAADWLERIPFVHWFLTRCGHAIYVARGRISLETVNEALSVLRAGGALGIAPEGTISRTGKLLKAQPGIAYLAARASAPVVPMVSYGQERAWEHWKRLRRVPIQIRVGAPFELPTGQLSKGELQAGADLVMSRLAQLLPVEYRGAYQSRHGASRPHPMTGRP